MVSKIKVQDGSQSKNSKVQNKYASLRFDVLFSVEVLTNSVPRFHKEYLTVCGEPFASSSGPRMTRRTNVCAGESHKLNSKYLENAVMQYVCILNLLLICVHGSEYSKVDHHSRR